MKQIKLKSESANKVRHPLIRPAELSFIEKVTKTNYRKRLVYG